MLRVTEIKAVITNAILEAIANACCFRATLQRIYWASSAQQYEYAILTMHLIPRRSVLDKA